MRKFKFKKFTTGIFLSNILCSTALAVCPTVITDCSSPTYNSPTIRALTEFNYPIHVTATTYNMKCDGITDDSAALNNAIVAAAALGSITHTGGIVTLPSGICLVQNIVMPSFVYINGQGKQFTKLKLPNNSNYNLLTTQNVASCIDSNSICGPTRIGLFNLTLDGNASNNISNVNGICFYSYAKGITIEHVNIQNCRRQGWYQEYAINWITGTDDSQGETTVYDLNIQRSGQINTGDIPGSAGNGGFYYNGPTDARFDKLLVGWNQGGYNLKIGPNGNGSFINSEFFGGGYSVDTLSLSSLTSSSTTATAITNSNNTLYTGQYVCITGSNQVNYNICAPITVINTTTFTYTLLSGAASPATGSITETPNYWTDWGIITESNTSQQGQFSNSNISGGLSGQLLVRKNGLQWWGGRFYLAAGNGTNAFFIQPGIQIGDTANGYTNVGGVLIDAIYATDILGPTIKFDSSGGFNTIKLRGYTNYSGYSTNVTGTPNVIDEFDINISGNSPVISTQQPFQLGTLLPLSSATITLSAASTTYWLGANGADPSGSSVATAFVIPFTGWITGFKVNSSTSPGTSHSYTYTLYKNTSIQAITGTISGATSASVEALGLIPVTAGDLIAVELVTSSGAAAALNTYTIYYKH